MTTLISGCSANDTRQTEQTEVDRSTNTKRSIGPESMVQSFSALLPPV
jgi:hypothetical protein